jgi:uncharacterized NAD(P)/FAD-binding protein YdhS
VILVAKPQLTELRYDPKLREPRSTPSDSPAPTRHVVIIGGGFAGIVTAIKLLDTARSPLRVTIVEPRAELGGGLAYSTRESAHPMNGPANLFSLHPERPEHFVQYLARFASDWSWTDPLAAQMANAFAPRPVYGDYLRSELTRAAAHAAPRARFAHVPAEATELRRRAGHIDVVLASGPPLAADHVVLALGANPSHPELPIDSPAKASGRYIANTWDLESFERLSLDADSEGDLTADGGKLLRGDAGWRRVQPCLGGRGDQMRHGPAGFATAILRRRRDRDR